MIKLKEAVKSFIYEWLHVPHWIIWSPKSGDDVFVDGFGVGKCINWWDNEYILCHFEWMDTWEPVYKEAVYYMYPEGNLRV